MRFVSLLMRIVLGAVFIYSGWSKLLSPVENFIAVIQGYQFLKPPFISPTAFILPWLELTLGSFLVLGFLTRFSASVLGIFLLMFIGLLARSILLHLPVSECGCFGSGIVLAPWQAVILDSGLLAVSFILVRRGNALWSLDGFLRR